MLARERIEPEAWVPPWLRHQHVARYEWARQFCRGDVVLDAACGSGYGSRILSAGGKVLSLDISETAISGARRSGPDLCLLLGDTTMLPIRTATVGVFASFETIEHVNDDASYVREARRVLRPGGVFICSTPNRILVNPGNSISDKPFNPFHIREYSASELRLLLARFFDDVTMMGQSPFSRRYSGMLRAVGRRWRNGAVRLHQMRKLALSPLETRGRHEPRLFAEHEEPEVLMAICR